MEAVRKFERELYAYLDREKPDILKEIKEKKALDDDLKRRIDEALREFKSKFTP